MWKDILGFEGKYQVNTNGQVISLKTGKLMAFQLGGNGYYKVGLRANGRKDRVIVHRLVAEAFIENPQGKSQVNHIDGNKLNNNVCNLEWVTPKENCDHAFHIGLRKPHYENIGLKFGSTSKYHYVELLNSSKDGRVYRAVVKATVNGKIFSKSKQFSITKHGEHEAEVKAALAANVLIQTHPEFKGYPLNVIC